MCSVLTYVGHLLYAMNIDFCNAFGQRVTRFKNCDELNAAQRYFVKRSSALLSKMQFQAHAELNLR